MLGHMLSHMIGHITKTGVATKHMYASLHTDVYSEVIQEYLIHIYQVGGTSLMDINKELASVM